MLVLSFQADSSILLPKAVEKSIFTRKKTKLPLKM